MSLNVLVIPEDPTHDHYALKPMCEALMRRIGRPQAKIRVCIDPVLGGTGEALKSIRLREIYDRYPMVSLFLLLIDRDSDTGRVARLRSLEQDATIHLGGGRP